MDATVSTKEATTRTGEYSVTASIPNQPSARVVQITGGATTSVTQQESLLAPAPVTAALTEAQKKAKQKDQRDREMMSQYEAGLIEAPDIDLTSTSSSNKDSEQSQDSDDPKMVGQRKLSVLDELKGQIEVRNQVTIDFSSLPIRPIFQRTHSSVIATRSRKKKEDEMKRKGKGPGKSSKSKK